MKTSTFLLNAALAQLAAAQSYTLQTAYGTGTDFFNGFTFFTVSAFSFKYPPIVPGLLTGCESK